VVVFFFFCLWTGNENRNRRPGHSCGPMSSKPRKRSLPARQKHQVARRSDTPSSAQQFQRATGSQWCDDEGNSLEWLEACGFTQEAARVRDRHRLRTDADDLCPGTPVRSDTAKSRESAPRADAQSPGSAAARQILTGCADREHGMSGSCASADVHSAGCADAREEIGLDASEHGSPRECSNGMSMDDLLRCAVRVAWQQGTARVPQAADIVYTGFITSVDMVSGTCECWISEDHSIISMPVATALQCVWKPCAANASVITAQCEGTLDLMAVSEFVFGPGVPPCVLDCEDHDVMGVSYLMFEATVSRPSRPVAWNMQDKVMADGRNSVLVTVMDTDKMSGVSGTVVCSQCVSKAGRASAHLLSKTAAPATAPACRHILALRYLYRKTQTDDKIPDHIVDQELYARGVRVSRLCAPDAVNDRMFMLDTAERCPFVVLQVAPK
jgi:hypothetical protein